MKNCPNCGEMIGSNADVCFFCKYDYKVGRVVSTVERREYEENRIAYENKRKVQEEIAQREKYYLLQKLPRYEYATETIYDNADGSINVATINAILAKYAKDGWRLVSSLSNEIGKNSTSAGIGGFASGTNATIDQVVLIFERLVSKGIL